VCAVIENRTEGGKRKGRGKYSLLELFVVPRIRYLLLLLYVHVLYVHGANIVAFISMHAGTGRQSVWSANVAG
jgi:hypothetical protein